jgi:hypothetical protein
MFSKKFKKLFLRLECLNGYKTLIEIQNSPSFEDSLISDIERSANQFHMNHQGQYVYHFTNGITFLIQFEKDLEIVYEFYKTCDFSDNILSTNEGFLKSFHLCRLCNNHEPIRINDKFWKKFLKYQINTPYSNRWKKFNMGFFNTKSDTIHIYTQIQQNDKLIYKKIKIPKRPETHKDCEEGSYVFKFVKGIFVAEHDCELEKYNHRVVNVVNDTNIFFCKNKSIPLFGSLFWVKKQNQFIIIDHEYGHNRSFLAISTPNHDEIITKDKSIYFMSLCKQSNQIFLWYYYNGVVVLNIDQFFSK